jgi:signal transduction histidine kinase
MNIKFKLTLWFTCIVGAILFGSFFVVYQNYSHFREVNFYERLNDRAHFITNLLLNDKNVDNQTVQVLSKYTLNITPNIRVSVYDDSTGQLMQSIGQTIPLDNNLKKKIDAAGLIQIAQNDTQYIYFTQQVGNTRILSLSCAYDKTGFSKVAYLHNLFLIILLFGVITTAIAGWWFSRYALKPINAVITDAQNITAKNLHQRLTIVNRNDEIGYLSKVFNRMLDRLEASFTLQKDFVSNASHEFRTPLTAMKGQIQVALLKDRSVNDYQTLLQSLNDDINNVISLLNALHELAKANADFPLKAFYPVPVLDVLIDSQNELIRLKPTFQIEISVDDTIDDTERASCLGDSTLLKSAFINLMDNGCKFSPNQKMSISISASAHTLKLTFTDEGVGIAPDNLSRIFEPFFRANDTRNVYGHGIGLSLVKRIIEWHKGKIAVHSELGKGTQFIIELPNLSVA